MRARPDLLQSLARRAACVWAVALALMAGGCYRGETAQEGDTTTGGSGSSGGGGSGGPASTGDEGSSQPAPAQPLHRLNRLEYNNTVRDLLGTSLRPADAFGPDPEVDGFDNMAEHLLVSSALLDGYDKAARAVIDDALDDVPAFQVEYRGEALKVEGAYPSGDLWPLGGSVLSLQVTVPAQTAAEIVLDAGAFVVGAAPAPQVHLRVNGVDLPAFVVQGSPAIPAAHVQPISLVAGVHTIEVVPDNYINTPADDAVGSNNVYMARLAVRSVDLAPGPGRSRIYVCEPAGPGDLECHAQILRTFAFRAWRRPLDAGEEAGLLDLFARLQEQGEEPGAALRLVMRAVMLSPKFFYRARTTADADAEGWLDDHVLASKLSYFLWSSMPDERLFAMAAEGRLATDAGLSEAVAFMLADERARALLDGFAEQWLSLRRLAGYSPGAEAYPEFDAEVRAAMAAEAKLFFGDFLGNGLPAAAIVLPDFAYRNDRLAEHYGLPAVGSAELVRVPAGGDERRGLLALGAWLTATSDAEHSSPIRRGRWVSERLLCNPPPPPPPGLEFDPPQFGDAGSVREELEKHRADPSCAGCHALLDVLGIGFEEYDGVARPVSDPNVDNLGELPDGRTFHGAGELAQLYADSEVFVGCLARKLFTYAAGRTPTLFDAPHLEALTAAATSERQSLAALIDALVHTPGFRSPAPLDGGE